jgi:hypothetical protein
VSNFRRVIKVRDCSRLEHWRMVHGVEIENVNKQGFYGKNGTEVGRMALCGNLFAFVYIVSFFSYIGCFLFYTCIINCFIK